MDFYGESPSRPFFPPASTSNPPAPPRWPHPSCASKLKPTLSALGIARRAPAVAYAAALTSACPRLSLALNVLPAEMRQASSPVHWIPAAAVGAVILMLAGALAAFPGYESHRYERSLEQQIAAIAPSAGRADQIDKEIAAAARRVQLLDDLRRGPKADMDALAELTKILPPPTWLSLLEISPKQVIVGGETNQAAPLLRLVDMSPLFESSEFQMGPVPIPTGAMFRIKANRKGVKQ